MPGLCCGRGSVIDEPEQMPSAAEDVLHARHCVVGVAMESGSGFANLDERGRIEGPPRRRERSAQNRRCMQSMRVRSSNQLPPVGKKLAAPASHEGALTS